jgi:hypothetical protein
MKIPRPGGIGIGVGAPRGITEGGTLVVTVSVVVLLIVIMSFAIL